LARTDNDSGIERFIRCQQRHGFGYLGGLTKALMFGLLAGEHNAAVR
jgi:hypothetical protein